MHNSDEGLEPLPDQEGGAQKGFLEMKKCAFQSRIRRGFGEGLQAPLKRLRQLMQIPPYSNCFGRWYLWGNRLARVQSFPKLL
jgi:hypothetical protein